MSAILSVRIPENVILVPLRQIPEWWLAMHHEKHYDYILGTKIGWKAGGPFGMNVADRRNHVYIIGKTGSGKTSLLKNMLIQHLERGDGIGLIDPHGDLAEELIAHIPRHRSNDLIYFDPSDLEHPIGFNVLANVTKENRHLVASGVISAFRGLWSDSWGPRLEYILWNAVSALLHSSDSTLLGINRLLTDDKYRRRIIRQIDDPFLRQYWEVEYESYDPRFRRESIAPIQNKIGQFMLSPQIRNILGQIRNRVSIAHIMNHKQIFIANLSKGKLGEDKCNLLGSLLTTQFQLAAMSRVSIPEDERNDYFLFLDEFQNFSTDSFAGILSEARKFRLNLTISHQYMAQLSLPIQKAVFGNVGTIIAFKVGYSDAMALGGELGGDYPPQRFVEMERFHVLVRVLHQGVTSFPFPGCTLAPPIPRRSSTNKLRLHSRMRFAAKRSKIETKHEKWLGL
jgi:hypothetical protein